MHNLLIQKYVLSQNTYQIKVKNFIEIWFLFFTQIGLEYLDQPKKKI